VGTALILPGSWYVLSAGILASAVGALLARRSEPVVQEEV
jgi:hypothetical protein